MADKLVMMLLTIDPDQPHLCGTPFFQAAAAAAMDAEVEIYFASRATRLLVKGVADKIYPSDNKAKSVYGFMLDGQFDAGLLGVGLGAEKMTIWILLAVATANVVLGVWRPRLVRGSAS